MCFQDGGGSPEPKDVGVFQKLEKGKRSTHTVPPPRLPWSLQKGHSSANTVPVMPLTC